MPSRENIHFYAQIYPFFDEITQNPSPVRAVAWVGNLPAFTRIFLNPRPARAVAGVGIYPKN